MLFLLIIILYFVLIITIGILSKRNATGADNFFVAGRRGSSLFVTGSLLATIIGGSATVGMAGLGFSRGLTGAWWLLVGSIGLVVLGVFFAKKVREFGLYTLPELVEKQYDGRVALAASILIVVSWIGIIAGQIVAAGIILSVLGMGNPVLWMVAFSIIFIIYTVVGGQFAVIRTDVFQIAIIFVGILVGVLISVSQVGGFSGLYSSLPAGQAAFPLSSKFDGIDLVTLLLLVGLTYVVGPDMYSRLFCARDGKTARTSAFSAALLIIPLAFGITMIGMAASVLFPQISAEQAFPMVIKEVLPPVVGGIVLAALLCAVMSSADTTLLSAGTILTVDIIGKLKTSARQDRMMYYSRWWMVALGVTALVLALVLKGVISALLFAYTVYTAGVILPVIAGFYRGRLRVTSAGALAAIIGGGTAALLSRLLGIKYLDLGALLISGLLLLLVSFIDNWLKRRAT
jgi:SSS family solute:Na+ symporter